MLRPFQGGPMIISIGLGICSSLIKYWYRYHYYGYTIFVMITGILNIITNLILLLL